LIFTATAPIRTRTFEQQKNYINRRINEKRLLINEKAAEEYKMEEALDYCFNFIRDSRKNLERL